MINLTTKIVAAYLGNNSIATADVRAGEKVGHGSAPSWR